MTPYIITWRNPKSGAVEAWRTETDTPAALELSLAFWRDLGYKIISIKEATAP